MTIAYPFEQAVEDYVMSLDESQRRRLRATELNPQSADHWPWFEDVITRYELRNQSSPVRRDINERVEPDPLGLNSILWGGVGNEEPIFEASVLLKAARALLDADASR